MRDTELDERPIISAFGSERFSRRIDIGAIPCPGSARCERRAARSRILAGRGPLARP